MPLPVIALTPTAWGMQKQRQLGHHCREYIVAHPDVFVKLVQYETHTAHEGMHVA